MAPRSRPSNPAPTQLLARVRRFVERQKQIEPGNRVLAAVSGGPDSTCLLLSLAALRGTLDFELFAAHFDHGLRGERAASTERRLVERICQQLSVPLVCGSGDVRADSSRARRSVEDAARDIRYRFLAKAAQESRCSLVATGHTKNDQAETVLLHLLRGSGLRGLGGIAASSPWPFPLDHGLVPWLIRPLLDLTRSETVRCCRDAGIEPINDLTNRSSAFQRNRIRLKLIPELQAYNPKIVEALSGLAGAVRDDVDALEQVAADLVRNRRGETSLARAVFRRAPKGIQAHGIRQAYSAIAGDAKELGQRHVKAIQDAAAGPSGTSLNLPRGVLVQVRRESIAFLLARNRPAERLPDGLAELAVPGATTFGRWNFQADIIEPPARLDGNALVAYLNTAIGRRFKIRRRRDGDRFQPLGMATAKKLQDFLVDAHVPRADRDATPLLCARQGIAWVVGHRPAEWAKVRPGESRAVRVRATRSKKLPLDAS